MNVIVASVLHHYDLLASSKVNQEIRKFNRKPKKCVKPDMQVTVLDVDPDRNCFINHGLHLNSKGKTNVCMQLNSVVEKLSITYDRLPIPVEWIIGREEVTNTQCIKGPRNMNNSPSNTRFRVSNRLWKIPCNRNEDFLWEM